MKDDVLKMDGKENVSRHSWADLCRVVAIFGVILLHACDRTFHQFRQIPLSDWLAANFLDSLVRCTVPLFVMLSGALLLKADSKQITIQQVFQRAVKVILPLLTWNAGYLVYLSHFTGEPVQWLSMLAKPPMYHLWFVYMIVGVYVLLPIYQAIFERIVHNRNLQAYFLALWLTVNCIPIYQPIPLLSLLQQTSLFGYGGYFLIGGVIVASRNNKSFSAAWWLIYVLSVAVTFFLTFYFSQRAQAVVETAYLNFSLNVFAASIAAFVLFSRVEITGRLGSILHWISDKSFLIFFMHVVILERVSNTVLLLLPGLPAYLSILLSAFVTFSISLTVAAVLRLIPASRTVLG